jgi:hypothetical protein
MEGDEMCSVGFVALHEAPPGLDNIFTPGKLDDICGLKWNEHYLSPGDMRTTYLSIAYNRFDILPISMPLPVGHTILIGHFLPSTTGAASFCEALA